MHLHDLAFLGPGLLFLDQYFNSFIDEYLVLWLALVSSHHVFTRCPTFGFVVPSTLFLQSSITKRLQSYLTWWKKHLVLDVSNPVYVRVPFVTSQSGLSLSFISGNWDKQRKWLFSFMWTSMTGHINIIIRKLCWLDFFMMYNVFCGDQTHKKRIHLTFYCLHCLISVKCHQTFKGL